MAVKSVFSITVDHLDTLLVYHHGKVLSVEKNSYFTKINRCQFRTKWQISGSEILKTS